MLELIMYLQTHGRFVRNIKYTFGKLFLACVLSLWIDPNCLINCHQHVFSINLSKSNNVNKF